MGCHSKKSRIRIPHRLPIVVAAPAAVAGVAAAFALSPQALADTPAQASAHHAVVAQAAKQSGVTSAQLLSAVKQTAVAGQAARSADQPSSYTVQPGDSLSAIAGRVYNNTSAWPVLYWANQSKIQSADVIQPGQVLSVPVEPSRIPSPPSALGATSAPASQTSAQVQAPSVSQDPAPAASTDESSAPAASTDESSAPAASTDESSAPAASTDKSSAPAASTDTSSATQASSSSTPGGAFGQCVVQRESGGNAQVMNSSGHYGLYQFSASTWAEYGGNPAEFGNATVTEQNQVFANAMAAGGQSNWAPYDGC